MVVGPEYGAIIAAALGISKGDRDAIRDGLLALAVGFSAAIVLTFAFGVAVRARGHRHVVDGEGPFPAQVAGEREPLLMDRPDQIAPGPGRVSSAAGDPLSSPERAGGGVASEEGSGAGRKSLLLTRLRNT